MPRYFFTTDDGDHKHLDDIGHEMPGAKEARLAALDALPDMVRDKIPDGDSRTFQVSVRDEADEVIYVASLSLKGEWVKKPPAS